MLYAIKLNATIISSRDWANSSTGSGGVCAARAGEPGSAYTLAFQISFKIHKGDVLEHQKAKFTTEEQDNKNIQPVSCFPLTGAFVTWSREACAEQ